MRYLFSAELWRWDARREDWWFAIVPIEFSEEIAEVQGVRRGFGGVRVQVRVGASSWRTSVFPMVVDGSGTRAYALPMKRSVREAEAITAGRPFDVDLEVLDV